MSEYQTEHQTDGKRNRRRSQRRQGEKKTENKNNFLRHNNTSLTLFNRPRPMIKTDARLVFLIGVIDCV